MSTEKLAAVLIFLVVVALIGVILASGYQQLEMAKINFCQVNSAWVPCK